MSVNKFIRERDHGFICNQNDTWHGVKSVKNALATISSGPKYKKGSSWFEDLHDKVEPVATHFHWAIRNCEGDADKLRRSLDNMVEHYKNNHSDCHPTSRYKVDPNYEPSRVVIDNPKAEFALRNAIRNSSIYKFPEDFKLGRDTFFVGRVSTILSTFMKTKESCSAVTSTRYVHTSERATMLRKLLNSDRTFGTNTSKPYFRREILKFTKHFSVVNNVNTGY